VGIGLALARRLVEMHGGTIAAANLPSKGTEVAVRIPLAQPPEQEPRAEPKSRAATETRRVLVVDDNEDAAKALETVIIGDGHEVRVAATGDEALAAAREFKPHVVLLDIGLPDIDGYKLVPKLRQVPGGRGMRIVALTGYAGAENAERARSAGFDLHLAKPADPENLAKVIAASANRA
jgi:CheY-like chemotaxis protein